MTSASMSVIWNPISVTLEMVVNADKFSERYNLSP